MDKRSETLPEACQFHANETVSVETVRLVRELATAVSLDGVIGAAVVEAQVGAQGE